MKTTPLILDSLEHDGRRLVRIEARPNDPKNEAWLQELLYRHPELLPADAFDDTFAPAIPIGREVATGRGPIDNLYVSALGGITIVETKLWKNPEKHRTVVAQVIDYAKEVASWNYERFCSAVLDSSRRRGELQRASLEEKVAKVLREAGIELDEFQESVEKCLADGNFLLLIVGDRISPNIALLTKAIQSAPGLHFTIGLVEMQLYEVEQGQEWPLIIVPEIPGRTVNKARGVVRIVCTEKPQVTVEMDDGDEPGLGPTTKLDLDLFLRGVPKDLANPFRDAIEKWRSMGGTVEFTNKMVHLTCELGGESRRIIRCMTFQARLVTHELFEAWSQDGSLWERYLEELEASPVVSDMIRAGKQWIRFNKLAPHDLQVALEAGMALAARIKAADVDE